MPQSFWRTTASGVAAVLMAGSATAQDVNCNRSFDQASLNQCADANYRAADTRLNRTYQALRARLDTRSATELRDAQRAWIAYRDAMCAFVGGPSQGGSIHAMVMSNCLADLTTQQADNLQQQATCEEGDVSCVRR